MSFEIKPTTITAAQLPDNIVYTDSLVGSLGDYIPLTDKGQPNGVAELDADGMIPLAQMPVFTYVISTGSSTTIDTTALSSFNTIEYTISIDQGTKVRSSTVLVQNNGSVVDYTEYGVISTGGVISGIQVAASLSGTNSVLQITVGDAGSTNATVKFTKAVM